MSDTKSPSNMFTEEEIVQELHELGVQLPPDQLAHIKQELDALLALEHWSTHSVNGNEATENLDALRVLEQARRMHEQVLTRYHSDIQRVTEGGNVGSVLHQAQLLSELVHKDIARIDAVLTTLQPPKVENIEESGIDTKDVRNEITLNEAAELKCNCEKRPCLHIKAIQDLRAQLHKQGMTMEQIDAMRINLDDILQYQRAYSSPPDPLNLPTLRPTINMTDYGSLPFKHDPIARYELYKREWTRLPIPGEQRRQTLRWKVREFMLRHDCFLNAPLPKSILKQVNG